jgi:pimeloyl-ACP methyl ester carboxylesterase
MVAQFRGFLGENGMRSALPGVVCAALLYTLGMPSSPATAEPPKLPVPAFDQSAVGLRGYFYVGGQYVGEPDKTVMRGQAYVEVIAPKDVRRPYPLVLIHGNAQTPTNWMGTPDGRKGWADFFVEQGYIVYMLEQPMRGRSAWHASDGALRNFTVEQEQRLFTDNANSGDWPQAKKHTQWPGDGPNKGRKGDPVFDAFYATQVQALVSLGDTETANQAAGAALLDKIGPAVIIAHSQAGYFNWLIADKRPKLVKGNISIEPPGPPIENILFATGPGRAWGLTNIPITYDPPVADPQDIAVVKEEKADGPDLVACYKQKEPARQLPTLKGIPTLIIAAEASYHAVFDHCTAKWLNQAGVKTDFIRLEDKGLRGNGHMVMIEKNNLEIAKLLDDWMVANVK